MRSPSKNRLSALISPCSSIFRSVSAGSASAALGEPLGERATAAGTRPTTFAVDLPARRERGQQQVAGDRSIDARKRLKHIGIPSTRREVPPARRCRRGPDPSTGRPDGRRCPSREILQHQTKSAVVDDPRGVHLGSASAPGRRPAVERHLAAIAAEHFHGAARFGLRRAIWRSRSRARRRRSGGAGTAVTRIRCPAQSAGADVGDRPSQHRGEPPRRDVVNARRHVGS